MNQKWKYASFVIFFVTVVCASLYANAYAHNNAVNTYAVRWEQPTMLRTENNLKGEELINQWKQNTETLQHEFYEATGTKTKCYFTLQSCYFEVKADELTQINTQTPDGLEIIKSEEYFTPQYAVKSVGIENISEVNVETPWHLDAVGATRVHEEIVSTFPNSRVLLIDSGVDGRHPLLQNTFSGISRNFFPTILCPPGLEVTCDNSGHGTHVAGLISSVEYGVTKGGSEWGSYTTCNGSCDIHSIGLAFDEIAQLLVDEPEVHTVINFSIAAPYAVGSTNMELDPGIRNLESLNANFVMAAGNYGPNCGSEGYPAGGTGGGIPVTAYNVNKIIADFSSRGESPIRIDYPAGAAPGEDVLSTFNHGQVAELSGTSMAAPIVSGMLAMIRSTHNMSAEEAEAVLNQYVEPKQDGTCGGWEYEGDSGDHIYGRGLYNIYNVMSNLGVVKTAEVLVTLQDENGENLQGNVSLTNNGSTVRLLSGQKALVATKNYSVEAFVYGYKTNNVVNFNVREGMVNELTLVLEKENTYSLTGNIFGVEGPLFATLYVVVPEDTFNDYVATTRWNTTDLTDASNGTFSVEGLTEGKYEVNVGNPFCSTSVEVTIPQTTAVEIALSEPFYQAFESDLVQEEVPKVNGPKLLDCDECSEKIILENEVIFNGQIIDNITINSNGLIGLGSDYRFPSTIWSPRQLPRNNARNIIAPFWTDLDTYFQNEGVWYKELDEGGFVINWSMSPYQYLYREYTIDVTLEYKINGEFIVYYTEIPQLDFRNATIGLQINEDEYLQWGHDLIANLKLNNKALNWKNNVEGCTYNVTTKLSTPFIR